MSYILKKDLQGQIEANAVALSLTMIYRVKENKVASYVTKHALKINDDTVLASHAEDLKWHIMENYENKEIEGVEIGYEIELHRPVII